MPIVPTGFRAWCGPCQWQGRQRRDSLRSLTDYDAHLSSAEHAAGQLPPVPGDLIVQVPDGPLVIELVELDRTDDERDAATWSVNDAADHMRWWVQREPTGDTSEHRAWRAV